MSSFHRSYSREDPRLNRHASNTSPKTAKSPSNASLNNGQPPPAGDAWNAQTANYNHTQALQNAYQSLPYHNAGVHQYPTQTYYTGYQNYTYNPYENYQASQQVAYVNPAGEPRPPGDEYPHGGWTAVSNNYATEPPAAPPPPSLEFNNASANNDKKKTDAVAEEKIKQLAGLMKERETYEARVSSLKKKLRLLVAQKDELSSKRTPDKENLRIIKENTKLQVEIQSKIKDATNVIDILTNLIGDKKKPSKPVDVKPAQEDAPPLSGAGDKMNYKHFDPEVHWCRLCDKFPQSAKELLLHLHSKSHQTQAAAQEEVPWHKLPSEPKFPTHEGAPTKRVPIKGLQFFVASTAWYCRLCDVWIGDLHCASQHLMSVTHSQNYANFVEQNPRWETEWLKDREKALDRAKRCKNDSDSDAAQKRCDKYSPSALLDGKKKKKSKRRKKHSSDDSSSSSSSSSSSEDEEEDTSKSIRVAMRNKLLESEGKLDILEKIVRQGKKDDVAEDKLLSQWMTTATDPIGKDKQLLDNLKEKLKQKQDAEKAKLAFEAEILRRQKEREELERKDQESLEREALVKKEEEKQREKMSLKLKQQPSIRDSYRRRSSSRSPDSRRRRSRSYTPPRRGHHRNGRDYDERSPRYERSRRSRSRSHDRSRDRRRSGSKSREHRHEREHDDKDKNKSQAGKKLPFIGRMPLFKNVKPKSKEEDTPKREIKKEDYEPPRKTRFQPGNLARAFIPQPEVVCFPQLSSLPPIPPPPPPIKAAATPVSVPEPPKISAPKPPPPPKLQPPVVDAQKLAPKAERALMEAAREEAVDEEPDTDDMDAEPDQEHCEHVQSDVELGAMAAAHTQAAVPPPLPEDHTASEDYMLYEDPTNTMYQYGSMNYNMMYPPGAAAYNFMPMTGMPPGVGVDMSGEVEPPKSHTLPLEPPPLPPDDPNEDLAMLGLSSDDMAVQQML